MSAATQLARKDVKTGDLAAVQRAEAGVLLPTYDRNKLLLRSGRGESWARTAAEHGYYDEAHMANDISELAGATPHALLR